MKLTDSQIKFYKEYFDKRLSDKNKSNLFFKNIFKQIFEKGFLTTKQKEEIDFLIKNGSSKYELKKSLNEEIINHINKLGEFEIKNNVLYFKKEEVGTAFLYVSVFNNIKNIHLGEIVINLERRKQGLFNLFMEELVKYSETNNLIITTNPSDVYGIDRNTLIKLYKKYGFVENDYTDDDFLMDELYRMPKNKINEEKTPYKFGCLMLKTDLKNWSKFLNLIDDNDLYNDETNHHGKEKEPHVTILYGLHEEIKLQDIKNILHDVELPISGTVVNIGVFEQKDYDVLKFELKSKELTKLNNLIKKLPHTSDYPNYKPHLTLAYLKKGNSEKYLDKLKLSKEYIIVFNQFKFSESNGSKTV